MKTSMKTMKYKKKMNVLNPLSGSVEGKEATEENRDGSIRGKPIVRNTLAAAFCITIGVIAPFGGVSVTKVLGLSGLVGDVRAAELAQDVTPAEPLRPIRSELEVAPSAANETTVNRAAQDAADEPPCPTGTLPGFSLEEIEVLNAQGLAVVDGVAKNLAASAPGTSGRGSNFPASSALPTVSVSLLVDSAMPTPDLLVWAEDAKRLGLPLLVTGLPVVDTAEKLTTSGGPTFSGKAAAWSPIRLARGEANERMAPVVKTGATVQINPGVRRMVLERLGVTSEELPEPLLVISFGDMNTGRLHAVPGSARPLYGLSELLKDLQAEAEENAVEGNSIPTEEARREAQALAAWLDRRQASSSPVSGAASSWQEGADR